MNYEEMMSMKQPELKHKRMSMEERAAQFKPFAALSGFEEEIEMEDWMIRAERGK